MTENDQQPRNDRDDVAILVRLAGKRRAVPPVRAERVRAAARAQWQQEVRRRSRGRFFWAAAGLAVAASLILFVAVGILPLGGSATVNSGPMVVESLTGEAWTRDATEGTNPALLSLSIGDEILPGAELLTADGSRVAVRLNSGHSVRVDTTSSLRFEAGSISLDRGAVYVDSGANVSRTLDVLTPYGAVREIGTQFEVRLEPQSLRVRLREGEVMVRRGGESHRVVEGNELSWNRDGSVTRGSLSTFAPEWGWITDVTPMLDLEGLTARAFLNWVARERGLTVAFADQDVARSAAETVLSGTTEKLTLDEVLDAVLPTCRLNYRIDGAVLVIAAAPEEEPPVG